MIDLQPKNINFRCFRLATFQGARSKKNSQGAEKADVEGSPGRIVGAAQKKANDCKKAAAVFGGEDVSSHTF